MKKLLMKHYLLLIAICLLGNIPVTYAQKKTVRKSTVTKKTPTSEELLQQAEDYYDGTNGVLMNREKAKELFNKAADMGNIKAQKWMYAILTETDENPEAIKYLRMAAEHKEKDAMAELGRCYLHGVHGLPKDNEQSLYWLRLGAEHKSEKALMMLGIIYHEGYSNVAVDKDVASKYFKQAADLGDGLSCFLLGMSYEKGDGVQKDDKQAVYYIKKGADLGHDDSQWAYGTYLVDGFGGLEKDDKKAFEYFMKSAEQGNNKHAIYAVAEFYKKGLGGVTASKDEAKKWYAKASDSGLAKASIEIADFFCSDDNERLSWYQKAAEQGDITGQAEIAWAHCTGKIANYDTRAGAQELQKLSKTGNPRALYYFGEILRQGSCGIPKDKKAAKRIFESIKDCDDDKISFYATCILSQMK